ncbi:MULTISPECIES: tRNA lysidine(34) synthetase TilS [Vibrio]|uniref:tRNA(Ile)-lysidine synthase n=2 Tax=Vibrio TaxID=662 RepID=A0A7X4LGU4_9VIBR|nr:MULTISPECIES: tRNA lysidine(34) synthetase TilS [Vibrio]MBF8999397.1 tRNA lysidine(34) synthetase TilS [Vibrio nitrifigilis]MZI91653.1 tRNA lysidine(34) synthetase TilS [Vibrio eleionomae]
MTELYSYFAEQLGNIAPNKAVVAFSGGVDSHVLLTLLAQYRDTHKIDCLAVHVHHGLSAHADDWAEQCVCWGKKVGIPVVVEKVSLDFSSGQSLERVAREARYAALSKHVSHGDCLLLGQHADDQIETFLLALKRGSGPKGLSSMGALGPFAQGQLLRPLLGVTRSEIEAFAHEHHLEWVSDESNQDERFDRNFLRHQIVPLLTQRWSGFHQAVLRSAELCAQQELLLEELLADKLDQALYSDGSLSIEKLQDCTEQVRLQLCRYWLKQLNQPMPSRQHTEMIWYEVALASLDANPILTLGQYDIRRFQQRLYCVAHQRDISQWSDRLTLEQPVVLPDSLGSLQLIRTGKGQIALPKECKSVDIIFDPTGLSACPYGRVGSRKLKKLYQEYGVPSWLRRRLPILLYQQQVIAIAGLFVSRDFYGQECELIWDKSAHNVANFT